MNWFWAFLFTQVVEMPIYILGARTRWDEAFTASALTHPVVWFVFPRIFAVIFGMPSLSFVESRTQYWTMVVFAEVFAVAAEALYLAWLEKDRPFLWSLVANGASVSLGLLSRRLFGMP
jgi:hypothetical protein